MVLISILIEKSQVKILFNNFPLKAINKKKRQADIISIS
tara:strand:- start:201 stop:317 length:117 start_codon:yes stop_codon:yes gene_type:complete